MLKPTRNGDFYAAFETRRPLHDTTVKCRIGQICCESCLADKKQPPKKPEESDKSKRIFKKSSSMLVLKVLSILCSYQFALYLTLIKIVQGLNFGEKLDIIEANTPFA